MDHSKIPNEADWDRMLDELEDHVASLRKHSATARRRAKELVRDGYPTRSMPEGGGGGSADPTAAHVLALAGGTDGPDTWRGPHDPVGQAVRRMITETTDARNRLRGATAAMAKALPRVIDDVPREVCVSCGVSKKIAAKWVQSAGQCGPCNERFRRRQKAGEKAS